MTPKTSFYQLRSGTWDSKGSGKYLEGGKVPQSSASSCKMFTIRRAAFIRSTWLLHFEDAFFVCFIDILVAASKPAFGMSEAIFFGVLAGFEGSRRTNCRPALLPAHRGGGATLQHGWAEARRYHPQKAEGGRNLRRWRYGVSNCGSSAFRARLIGIAKLMDKLEGCLHTQV